MTNSWDCWLDGVKQDVLRGELTALRARLTGNREMHPLLDIAGRTPDPEESMRRFWREVAGQLDGNSPPNMLTKFIGYHIVD